MARDNKWLAGHLESIWRTYFPDVPIRNEVIVRFGRPARTRLGSIKFGRRKINPRTYITITGYFRDEGVPEFVVDGVLAHELSHYVHGFSSPHERTFKYPHKHGVVTKELTGRGLRDTIKKQRQWLTGNWRQFVGKH